jgi:hypothetical protein
MREHSTTAKTLLAMISLTSGEELFELTHGEATGDEQRAAQRLAHAAWTAISAIDDAERMADAELTRMERAIAEQRRNAAANLNRDAGWITQAARVYAERVATIAAEIEKFHAAAFPLALILGMPTRTATEAAAAIAAA